MGEGELIANGMYVTSTSIFSCLTQRRIRISVLFSFASVGTFPFITAIRRRLADLLLGPDLAARVYGSLPKED